MKPEAFDKEEQQPTHPSTQLSSGPLAAREGRIGDTRRELEGVPPAGPGTVGYEAATTGY